VSLWRLYLLCHFFNAKIFKLFGYNVVSFSSPYVTRLELATFPRIYRHILGLNRFPQFKEIQPDQSVTIEFPLLSLVLNRYDQPLPQGISQVVGYLTLYQWVYPDSTEILTYLENYQFPNVQVLILCNFDNVIDIMRSLSQENFKSLKYIMAIRNPFDDKTIWCQTLYLFPLAYPPLSSVKLF